MQDIYHAHEALDRSYLALQIFENMLVDHPFVNGNLEVKAEVDAVADRIAGLYQMIGGIVSAEDPLKNNS